MNHDEAGSLAGLIKMIHADLQERVPVWIEYTEQSYCDKCGTAHLVPERVYQALLGIIARNMVHYDPSLTEDDLVEIMRATYRTVTSLLVQMEKKQ